MPRLTIMAAIALVGCALAVPSRANDSSDNIATIGYGASVIYASPLAHGNSPNQLVNPTSPKPLSFAKGGSNAFMVVIDLGKSYDLNTVSLSFSKPCQVSVYVVNSRPVGSASWVSEIENAPPAGTLKKSGTSVSLNGASGEYLVLVFNSNPGYFFGLKVTGFPTTPRDVEHHTLYGDPLDRTPASASHYPGNQPASP